MLRLGRQPIFRSAVCPVCFRPSSRTGLSRAGTAVGVGVFRIPFVRIVEVRNEAFRSGRPAGRSCRWRFPHPQAEQAGRLSAGSTTAANPSAAARATFVAADGSGEGARPGSPWQQAAMAR